MIHWNWLRMNLFLTVTSKNQRSPMNHAFRHPLQRNSSVFNDQSPTIARLYKISLSHNCRLVGFALKLHFVHYVKNKCKNSKKKLTSAKIHKKIWVEQKKVEFLAPSLTQRDVLEVCNPDAIFRGFQATLSADLMKFMFFGNFPSFFTFSIHFGRRKTLKFTSFLQFFLYFFTSMFFSLFFTFKWKSWINLFGFLLISTDLWQIFYGYFGTMH